MLNEKTARGIGDARVEIAYETLGNPAYPAVLLITGLTARMDYWPAGFLQALLDRRLRVICFDNRDAGHSMHLDHPPSPDLLLARAGNHSSAFNNLSNMASDTVRILDFLGIDSAHVVGTSMGSAIAQVMALEYPGRVRSLTSMMPTAGDMSTRQMHSETKAALLEKEEITTRESSIERAVRTAPIIRSPAYPTAPAKLARVAGLARSQDNDQGAIGRQAVALIAPEDRVDKLGNIAIPTLIMHGPQDTVCNVSGGRATAAAIPGAEHVLIEGMGHDLAPGLWGSIADYIATMVYRSESVRFRRRRTAQRSYYALRHSRS
ncbi:MAG TPA: alpha/beta hydrolase [Noviherbaspirillum sp.]|nr:alpha/beta hydrolase [Noviherbaspirillum sp.]